ncbi:MAG: hypothetical protein AAFX99_36445, partial [Myxococcota bacterium]
MSRPQRIIIKSTPDDVTRALLGHMREVILAAVERRGRAALGFSWDEHTTQVLLAMVRFGGLPWEQLDTYLIHENPEGTLHREVFDVALAHVDMDPKHFHTLPAAHLPACFDLLLLGIGPGGQVAGLIPGVALPEGPPVVATPAGFTLTPSAIQAAEQLVVVGLGPECSGDVARALHGPLQPAALPVQHALEGVWYLDADAAEHLEDTHKEEAMRQEAATHEEKATGSTRETRDDDSDGDTFSGPRTLAIDIGGTGIKMLVMDPDGKPITERTRVKTPQPATPEAVLTVIGAQAGDHRHPFKGSMV